MNLESQYKLWLFHQVNDAFENCVESADMLSSIIKDGDYSGFVDYLNSVMTVDLYKQVLSEAIKQLDHELCDGNNLSEIIEDPVTHLLQFWLHIEDWDALFRNHEPESEESQESQESSQES